MKKLTLAEHRRINHQTFIRNKRAAGWRYLSVMVPPSVYDAMIETKRAKMIEHRLLKLQAQLKSP